MTYILFDDELRTAFLPFTHTRAVADIRCGILTMRERWEYHLKVTNTGTLTSPDVQGIYPLQPEGEIMMLNSRVFCTEEMAEIISVLAAGNKLVSGNTIIAARIESGQKPDTEAFTNLTSHPYRYPIDELFTATDIFSNNDAAIVSDFEDMIGVNYNSPLPDGVLAYGFHSLYIHPEAIVAPGVIINKKGGPVYIGKGAEIMEGCLIRGPLALCDGATLKMGAKVYGSTTIGPNCKVGGEVSNVVFFANSNKGHDGFLGNAVIGEWCNLGADTNCSNLKNNYDEVKIWDEAQMKSVKTGLAFCGLLMGDHSKCGINTMFNTGTVVGVSCNIWGGGFPEKFIPSFSWGGPEGTTTYSFDRAAETASRMMARRGKSLSEEGKEMLKNVFDKTKSQRDLFHQSA